MMIDADELPSDGLDGVTAILDCRRRRLIIDPDLSELERYSDERRRTEARSEELSELIGRQSVTPSGRRVYLCSELELRADRLSPSCIPAGGDPRVLITTDGIMSSPDGEPDPSEDGQYAVYKKWAESPYDVTVRLFEHPPSELWQTLRGGISSSSGLHGAGLFGLLRSTYKTQIKALLRAAAHGRLSILVPSLCGVSEQSQLRSIIREAKGELRESGTEFSEPYAIGVELSTPAAVLEAEALSGEFDFTVIDLDRLVSLTSGAELYDPLSEDRLRGGITPALGLCAHAVELSRGRGDLIGVRGTLISEVELTHTLIDSGFELLFLGSDGILPVKEQVLSYDGD